ncbi:hypothetical protein GCK72_023086 [Caenorhabditis remanei]|uniref:Uncharacterized protein n=1 Tax=Caenorhabditis remanei TaxID=31234 RepID=A0A6A5FW40_CAERE|nr:hypothetical protein GCK72_023086 [Caenorhabditis remanei]KAF1746629.1 hypothetical protein GCK72_023086 [Caenorhabditis remanei]
MEFDRLFTEKNHPMRRISDVTMTVHPPFENDDIVEIARSRPPPSQKKPAPPKKPRKKEEFFPHIKVPVVPRPRPPPRPKPKPKPKKTPGSSHAAAALKAALETPAEPYISVLTAEGFEHYMEVFRRRPPVDLEFLNKPVFGAGLAVPLAPTSAVQVSDTLTSQKVDRPPSNGNSFVTPTRESSRVGPMDEIREQNSGQAMMEACEPEIPGIVRCNPTGQLHRTCLHNYAIEVYPQNRPWLMNVEEKRDSSGQITPPASFSHMPEPAATQPVFPAQPIRPIPILSYGLASWVITKQSQLQNLPSLTGNIPKQPTYNR